jgi:hypothetical protein
VEDGGCEGAIAAEVAAKILILGSLISGHRVNRHCTSGSGPASDMNAYTDAVDCSVLQRRLKGTMLELEEQAQLSVARGDLSRLEVVYEVGQLIVI